MPTKRSDDFKHMPISELMVHEKGILNLLDVCDKSPTALGSNSKETPYFALGISQEEYDSIFHDNPTFYEKRAFVEMFRRKWREDKGLCSLFDKRPMYRKAAAAGKQSDMKNLLRAAKTAPESPKNLGLRQQFVRPQTQGGASHF